MSKLIHFVYLTINKINEKQYIGDHSTSNIDDLYLGSGKIIIDSIKKYGKENFKRKILEQFETKEQAFNAQEKYINKYNTLVPNGYNISPSGGTWNNGKHSQETKQKISLALLNMTSKWKDEIRKRRLGTKHKKDTILKMKNRLFSEEHRKKISFANARRIWTEESKQKMSNSKKGQKHSEITKNKISESHKGLKQSNETIKKRVNKIKGIKLSKEHKLKIKESKKLELKIKCEYCEIETNKGNYIRWHGQKCKYK